MEISIPWTLINTIPLPGKTMGLLVANNDRDNGTSAQLDWLDLIETGNYARPNLWGNIVLSDELAGSSGCLVINSFTATPSSLANPWNQVTFDVDATDPDHDSMNYTISFGDESANGSGAHTVHTYTKEGNYVAKVTVDDGHGNTVTKSIQITVNNRPPSAPTDVTTIIQS
jgi:PKD repeat protein